MDKKPGIGLILFGLVVTILGFSQILPNLGALGIFLSLLGLILVGLSFVPMPESNDVPALSTSVRLAKILYAPTEVFQNLRFHAGWITGALIMATIGGVYEYAFVQRITPDRIAN